MVVKCDDIIRKRNKSSGKEKFTTENNDGASHSSGDRAGSVCCV